MPRPTNPHAKVGLGNKREASRAEAELVMGVRSRQ